MPELGRSERWTGPNAGIPDGVPMPPTSHRQTRQKVIAEGQRVRAGGAPRRPQRGDGWRIQVSDERLLAALTRYGTMNWRMATKHFYGGVDKTGLKRIRLLRDAQYLALSRNHEWAGRVLLGRSAGTTLVRDRLAVPLRAAERPPGERLLHRLAVADIGLRFEARGERVLTEREIRTAEATTGLASRLAASLDVPVRSEVDGNDRERWFAVPVGKRDAVHYPDLVLVTPGGLIAVEVEITVKAGHRLREILRGYRDSRQFAQVIYFATAPVGALLHGWRDPDGEWEKGVLQHLHLLPDGPPSYTPDSRIRVQPIHAHDPGVSYELDMRQMPDGCWIPKSRWNELRATWEADTDSGKNAQVPFLRWWRNIEAPRRGAA